MNINAVKREIDVPCFSLSLSSLITNFYPILSSLVDIQQELLLMGNLSIFLSAKNWEWKGSMTQDLWKKKPTSSNNCLLLDFEPSSFHPPLFHRALTASWSCSQIPQVIVFPQPQELQPAEAAVPEGSSSPPCGLQLIFYHFPGGQRCSERVLPPHTFSFRHTSLLVV